TSGEVVGIDVADEMLRRAGHASAEIRNVRYLWGSAENIPAEDNHFTKVLSVESLDRKSTRLNSSHLVISYAVFCLKKKNNINQQISTYMAIKFTCRSLMQYIVQYPMGLYVVSVLLSSLLFLAFRAILPLISF